MLTPILQVNQTQLRDDNCCEVEVDIDGSTKRDYFVQILQYRPLNGPPAREFNNFAEFPLV